MSDRADSYFYMYTGDYLRDTMHLTTRQHGAYTLLLMHYYGAMKPLPASQETLRTIARLSDKDWKVDGPVVMAFFNLEPDGWHQKRADKEIAKASKRYDKAVAASAAKHGHKQAPSTIQAASEQAPSTCLDGANPNPNHSRTPLRGGSTRGARRAAAQSQPAAPPVGPDWADDIPEWREFKAKLEPAEWLAWFSGLRPNGSIASLVLNSAFDREQIEARYLTRLVAHFGGEFELKVKDQKGASQ